MPFFSIIIPLYNKQDHIKNTIESVRNQTFKDFEMIVINDGSIDNSVSIVESIQDKKIKLISQNNQGVSAARNRGIKEAKADFISFLDADDIWYENHLEIIHKLIIEHPSAGIYSTAYEVRKNNKICQLKFMGLPKGFRDGIIPNFFKTLALGANPTFSSVVVLKKNIFDKVGLFPEGVRMGEDLDMWIRAGIKYKVCFSLKTTAIYDLDANNRACRSYTAEDLNSIMFTKWFEYLNMNDSIYLKQFIKKSQLNFLYNLVMSGLGKSVRKKVIPMMLCKYLCFDVFFLYFISFLNKRKIDKIKNLKNKFKP